MPDSQDASTSGTHRCPRCGGVVYRIHRRGFDRFVDAFIPIGRFRCKDKGCDWQGRQTDVRDGRPAWQNLVRSPATMFLALALLGPIAGIGAWYFGSRMLDHGDNDDVARQVVLSPGKAPGSATAQVHAPPAGAVAAAPAPVQPPAAAPKVPRETAAEEPARDCVWEGPARQPYTGGTIETALNAAQLPPEIVGKVVTMHLRGLVSDRLEITSAGIRSADQQRRFSDVAKVMALEGRICYQTRIRIPAGVSIPADLYDLIDGGSTRYSVMISPSGGNVALLEEQAAPR
jgi:hypothetical protein